VNQAKMTSNSLGIDISKKDFDVILITGETRTKPRKFTNDLEGFESLQQWLKQKQIDRLHACLVALFTSGNKGVRAPLFGMALSWTRYPPLSKICCVVGCINLPAAP
jgi:hypothetical protein